MTLRDLVHRGGKQTPEHVHHPWDNLQREVNHLFDEFSRGLTHSWTNTEERSFAPRIDVVESDDALELTAELPGLTEKDVELSLSSSGDAITLRGEKRSSRERTAEHSYYSERYFGSFERTLALCAVVDAAQIKATFTDGVLTVHMPKAHAPESQGRRIPVNLES